MAIDRKTQPTGLLSLPLEIRLQIYDLLLILPPTTCLKSSYHSAQFLRDNRIHAAILVANRQLHHEATPILYTRNAFVAHPSLLVAFPRLRLWYPPITAVAVLPRIRRFHVQIRLDADLPFAPDAAAVAFSGLDELRVHVVQAVFLGSGAANLRCFEAVRDVARVSVRGSTTGFEEYVRWLEDVMRAGRDEEVGEFKASAPGWADRLVAAL